MNQINPSLFLQDGFNLQDSNRTRATTCNSVYVAYTQTMVYLCSDIKKNMQQLLWGFRLYRFTIEVFLGKDVHVWTVAIGTQSRATKPMTLHGSVFINTFVGSLLQDTSWLDLSIFPTVRSPEGLCPHLYITETVFYVFRWCFLYSMNDKTSNCPVLFICWRIGG